MAAAIAYAIPALATQHLRSRCPSLPAPGLGTACPAAGLGLLGELPHFGFAPALSITAWLVLTVYVVQQLYPQLRSRWPLSILGSVAVLLAVVFPGTPLHVNARPGCRCIWLWYCLLRPVCRSRRSWRADEPCRAADAPGRRP
jgi:hypothetical protein